MFVWFYKNSVYLPDIYKEDCSETQRMRNE